MNSVYITQTASFLPNPPVSNDNIESVLGKLDHQPGRVKQIVLSNNGILTRHYAIDPVTGSKTHSNAQLAAEAVRQLLDAAGLPLAEIQGLACGTASSDQLIPSHANMVAGELGMEPAEVVSTAGVCASGMSAFKYGYMNLALGLAENFVVTGSECASSFMHKKNFDPIVGRLLAEHDGSAIFGFEKEFLRWMLSDGAGAVLLETQPRPNRINFRVDEFHLRCWAGKLPVCMYAGMNKNSDGTFKHWYDEDDRNQITQLGYLLLQQDARALSEHMVNVGAEGLQYLVKTCGIDLENIDWFLPHLSSMYFKEILFERFVSIGLEIPESKWFTNLAEKGNTGSASIFIILDELAESGRLQPGQTILCAVPESARFTMAGMLLTVC